MNSREIRWNREKAAANLSMHGISFENASEVFDDPLAVMRSDSLHSYGEDRFILTGLSSGGVLLTVVFTVRDERAWLISTRRSTAAERRRYMEEKDMVRDKEIDDFEMLDDYGQMDGWMRNPFKFHVPARVYLDEDVAREFRTSEEVNAALRLLIAQRSGSTA